MTPPVYLVSGFPRSGTSMMMRALDAGGIPAVRDPERDRAVRGVATLYGRGYDPNPHGYYEVSDLRGLDWATCRGRCVKVVRDNLPDLLPNGDYRVVYMTRDPSEIRRSLPSTFAVPPSEFEYRDLNDYWANVTADVRRLESLGAVVTRLHYPEAVENPYATFAGLVAAGWPLDVFAAAACVDQALYRHRGGVR